ncbi:hypothetical protein GCM10022255_104960 [Dactylosporangium darangshiense]|uniref:Uncharacterized protein n=1 Tax=Dactylosporangium darangshiense TaxID=579108 RepID=A0ABP8DTK2_9ACTN
MQNRPERIIVERKCCPSTDDGGVVAYAPMYLLPGYKSDKSWRASARLVAKARAYVVSVGMTGLGMAPPKRRSRFA